MYSLVYEMAGEDDDDAMDMSYQLPKKLSDLKIGSGSVYIEDFLQELRVQMVVLHTYARAWWPAMCLAWCFAHMNRCGCGSLVRTCEWDVGRKS